MQYKQDNIIDVVEGKYVENLQTGLTLCDDGQINEGDECLTQYTDGEKYNAIVLHIAGKIYVVRYRYRLKIATLL